MLLIIPAMEIREGRCVRTAQGVDGFGYPVDPVQVAKLWRTENAKSLHVTDLDGVREGRVVNGDIIRRLVQNVDIPIILGGGLVTLEAVRWAFDTGVYRALISAMLVDNPDELKRVIEEFGATKVVLGIYAVDGVFVRRGTMSSSGLTALSAALNAKALGFRRVVYTDIDAEGNPARVNLKILREIGEKTGMRVTAAGGVTGLEDLLKIQELERYGIDSVVIGRALYENRFSCQATWRRSEAGDYPHTAKL
jgi:phosphoribosylformimino-5-aminoimidazole carboxamide ribotide isomerase